MLEVEQFNPLLRAEAARLLGRARAALGDKAEACKAVERAVADAKAGRYIWMEMLAMRDLAQLCEAADAKAVEERLKGVKGRMAAMDSQYTFASPADRRHGLTQHVRFSRV